MGSLAWTWLVNDKQIGTLWYDTLDEAVEDVQNVIGAANALGMDVQTVKLIKEIV